MKRAVFAVCIPLLMAPVLPVAAQTGAQCAAIGDDGERLACYDTLFRTAAGAAPLASVTLESEQLIPARPTGRAPATITVSCEAEGLKVTFGFAGNTMSSIGRDVGLTLQNDLARARSSTLPVNAENTAVLINNTADTISFLDSLEGTTNLTVRVTPVSTRSLSVRFRVDAFPAEVAPVVAACE
ncbi:hypothetical protein [Devosia lucknowensis]|uniref:hypothetical protein n=1 Tax=Devosia lucknowensis TaxID=1096929 RepID=UPI00112357F5|nr:hypothetical protein [Devosia lucknowensis]